MYTLSTGREEINGKTYFHAYLNDEYIATTKSYMEHMDFFEKVNDMLRIKQTVYIGDDGHAWTESEFRKIYEDQKDDFKGSFDDFVDTCVNYAKTVKVIESEGWEDEDWKDEDVF